MKIKKILIPTFLEEAKMYLSTKPVIIGGGTFLRMSYKDGEIKEAMSLSKLDLDYIKYFDDRVEIGPTATLHQLETERKLNELFDDTFKEILVHIVGVQFRNIATIGGSVAARLGYSEPISLLLLLNAGLELKGSIKISLEEYLASTTYKNTLITKIFIPIVNVKIAFKSIRNSETDLPAFILGVSADKNDEIRIVIGARPSVAQVATKASDYLSSLNKIISSDIEKATRMVLEELDFGSDIRADAEYRKSLVSTLLPNMISEVLKWK
jgi:CO/xanthine dehydrogenase FAD-binding subunit